MRRRRSVTVQLHHRFFQYARSSSRTARSPKPSGWVRLLPGVPGRRSGRSSDGACLKSTRARRTTAGLHQFFSHRGKTELSDWSHKPCCRGRDSHSRIQFLFSTERSLEVRHSAWDRAQACASHAAPTTFLFQVRGSVSGASAREAEEAGASPAHLTSSFPVTEDKLAESPACLAGVSGGSTRRSRHLSRRGVA